ncbi:MAG: TetR/AcrR family transcriptional regulator C-terminal domain-containing protein [Lachnospiraceae bacterium]|nr:TetR/AcrR family transcriptional regulator C-terminal domain-containing protein [Lachnospiraceae bacterium]
MRQIADESAREGFFDYIEDPVSRKLMNALERMMQKRFFDDISVTDILKESGISRSTFYRRYRDKYDLLNQNYQILLNHTLMQIPAGMSYKQSFYTLYNALKSYPAFFKNALSSREDDGLRSYIFKTCYQIFDELMRKQGLDMDSVYYRMLLTGYLRGSLEITCIWVEDGMKEPLDELFRISYELMPHEIRTQLALSYM